MNMLETARLENAARRAGHKIVIDAPKPMVPADSDEVKILASMREGRIYTANDIAVRTGLAAAIVAHRVNSMAKRGKLRVEGPVLGDMIYSLPQPKAKKRRAVYPKQPKPRDRENAIIADAKTMNCLQLAKKYGTTRNTIYMILYRANVQAPKAPRHTPDGVLFDLALAQSQRVQGWSYREIAEHQNVGRSTARSKLLGSVKKMLTAD